MCLDVALQHERGLVANSRNERLRERIGKGAGRAWPACCFASEQKGQQVAVIENRDGPRAYAGPVSAYAEHVTNGRG